MARRRTGQPFRFRMECGGRVGSVGPTASFDASPVECSAVCAGFALVCDYASTSACAQLSRRIGGLSAPSARRSIRASIVTARCTVSENLEARRPLCTAPQHSKSTLTAPKQMGRSKFNKRHMKQAYAGNAFNHGRAIPTRDQRQTPPREAYFLVNLLYCVSFLVIGGALLSLRS